jgi:hypothetical protein
MRIINVLPRPQHLSYASTAPGGRTLRPGGETPELPFERLLIPLLRKDVEKGNIQIKLGDGDRDIIQWMLDQDARKVVHKKLPPKPRPPKKKRPARPKGPDVPRNPKGTPLGQPDIQSKPSDKPNMPPAPSMENPHPEDDEGTDLAALRAQNERTSAIRNFMGGPLGSPGGV